MGLKQIKKVLTGEYYQKKIEKVECRIVGIKKILAAGTSQNMASYFEKKLKRLEREKDAVKLGFFIGGNISRSLLNVQKSLIYYYELLYSIFGQNDQFVLDDLYLPVMTSPSDKRIFMHEFEDIVLPYLLGNVDDGLIYGEGPYELKEHVCLQQNDVVIDCGANIGMFSAVSSAKGCKIYAFEPMSYIIDTYLSKTAEWNKNIVICPYALSDQKKSLIFELREDNIGASRETTTPPAQQQSRQYYQVQAITLDDFVSDNGLETVDFIKADIEGAERYMLLGAKNTIRKFSPKISICTYHLPDDPQVLREILLDIQPRYKIIEKYQKMYAYLP